MNIDGIKIRVNSPIESEKVQKKLFSLGAEWSDGKIVQHCEKPFLFCDKKNISYADELGFFVVQPEREVKVEDLVKEGKLDKLKKRLLR